MMFTFLIIFRQGWKWLICGSCYASLQSPVYKVRKIFIRINFHLTFSFVRFWRKLQNFLDREWLKKSIEFFKYCGRTFRASQPKIYECCVFFMTENRDISVDIPNHESKAVLRVNYIAQGVKIAIISYRIFLRSKKIENPEIIPPPLQLRSGEYVYSISTISNHPSSF